MKKTKDPEPVVSSFSREDVELLNFDIFQINEAGENIAGDLFKFRDDWGDGGSGSFTYLYGQKIGSVVTIGIQLDTIPIPSTDSALRTGRFHLSVLALPFNFRPIGTIPGDFSLRAVGTAELDFSDGVDVVLVLNAVQPEFSVKLQAPQGGQGVPATEPFIRVKAVWKIALSEDAHMDVGAVITYDLAQ